MEMNRAELAAVDGVACDLLDARGRLVVTPNALTLDGQRNVPADLQAGETLDAFLRRHVPGIESGAWTVMIGGSTVPQAMWSRTFPKHGQVIACRAVVAKQVVQLAAIAALSYFTMGGGAGWIAKGLGVAAGGFAASAAGLGAFMAGSMLINKVLGPKVTKAGEAAAARQVYSLSGQRNSARAYEPLPVLWGEMRVTPDLAGQPYTWFEGDEQYLSTILLGGVNVHSASDLAIGDTPITSFEEVSTFFNGFSGMPNQDVPLYSNADSIAGGELMNDGPWVTRTSSADTIALQVDIEGQLYDVSGDRFLVNSVPLLIETRRVGASAWSTAVNETLSNAATDLLRRTYTLPVAQGKHEVRVRIGKPLWDEGEGKDACKLAWSVLKSIQPDTTDYSQWGRIGIKIKATGQVSGSLDTLRATYRARPLPVWNGAEWITATTRAEGLSNPGAILLQTLRGVYANGVLQFGFGMSDAQIDIEGLKAFMLHCTARGYTYDRWITGSMSLGQFCDEVALAGMGEFSWTDGSRPTAVFVSSGQPLSGVVNMANMLKGSFSVAYNLANAADGIEYQYLDRDRNWETQTLRVAAPGVTTMLSPARITGEGVTSEAHAAVLARYHLAQSLYQYKTIDYGADIEHLAYRRLSVLSISHDLTQWGYGGRVMAAVLNASGKVELKLDEPVPPMAQAYVGLRVPGARDYRVFKVEALEAESDWITLVEPWPAGVKFPGADLDNPAHDTLWCYDFKPTPGYRVRVVGMQPEADLKGAQVTCVPEGPEFWDYVLKGTYTPAPNQSSLPQLGRPTVSNLRITEKVNVQGDTEWYSLSLVWDVEGDYDHAQVWAGRDGSELRLVDGNAVGSRAEFRIDGAGEWLVEVRPFNASGLVGQSATVLYITTQTQLPPRNVDEFVVQNVAGGLRRFAWMYTGDRPPAFAGVQIRYVPGDVQLSVADWDGMQPLGEAGDIYGAQFETTRPQAGLWTFGCRAIDTAGQLSNGVVRFVASLEDSFEQVQQPDMTPPPAPTGVTAAGMLSTVQVSWDAPLYTQGHGHARTEVWAGLTAVREDADKLAEGYAGPVSFGTEPGQIWHIWARHVTSDRVPGPWADPVTAETGADVGGLLGVLAGELGRAQLDPVVLEKIDQVDLIDFERIDALNDIAIPQLEAIAQVDLGRIAVIDLIDKEGGPLGKSLITAASQQDALNQQVRGNMEDMARGLLEAALAADAALGRISDAGVYVDLSTGTVKIYGLDLTNEQVTNLSVLLDSLNGQLQLKATTAYVDGKIAQAVLSPADLLLYEGLDARLITVAQQLDSINGTLNSKAEALELRDAVVRLSTAESSLDALSAQIDLRVTRAEYEAAQGGLQERLSSAEIQLSALDAPSIAATVTAVSRLQRDADKTAQALLQDILTGERDRVQAQDALAFARNELNASIHDGLAAEAAARTQLAATVDQQAAALEQESRVRADADSAEAAARQQLAATVASGQHAGTAALEQEAQVRASADAAEALARDQLQAQLEGEQGSLRARIDAEEIARVGADNAEAAARQQLTAQVAGNQTAALAAAQAAADAAGAKGKVLVQSVAPAAADRLAQNLWIDTTEGANTPKRWTGSAWVAVTDKVATDAAAAAAAAAQSATEAKAQITAESQARATADQAEATARQQLAAQVQQEQQAIQAQVTAESQARANGDSAEAAARQQLAVAVEDGQRQLQAQVTAEALARVEGDRAETSSRENQISASRRLSEKDAERAALATLQDVLTGERNKAEAAATLAMAKTELSTQIQEGLSAEAAQRSQLAAVVGGQAAALEQESRVRADENEAEATARQALAAQVQAGQSQNVAALQSEAQTRAEADLAEAAARQVLAAKVQTDQEAIQAQVAAETLARTTADSAEATARQQLAAAVADQQQAIQAQVTAESQARADADSAEALARQQLEASVGGSLAAVEQKFTVQAGINGYLAARYSLAVQVGSDGQLVVGGMQITGSSDDGAGPKIAVAFATDMFSIVSPDGTKKTTPFYVQPSDMTINGVVVPAGAYMDSARIGNVEAILGRFGTLFADKVQATAISASQLTAGNGVIGGTLKSSNYVAGSSGWTLRPDGVVEFSGVIARGTIIATSGSIGPININGNGLNSGGFSGNSWPVGNATGFHIGQYGMLFGNPSVGRYLQITESGNFYAPHFTLENGNATFGGRLNAATGVFSGSLSAVNGTFSGTLTAANIVNTSHVVPNAITVPVAVQGHTASIYMESAGQVTVMIFFSPEQVPVNGTISIARNGAFIYNQGIIAGTPERSGTVMLVDNPGAGAHTYSVRLGGLLINQVNILLLGTKR